MWLQFGAGSGNGAHRSITPIDLHRCTFLQDTFSVRTMQFTNNQTFNLSISKQPTPQATVVLIFEGKYSYWPPSLNISRI